ncbi:MAG: hypothetical protein GYB53_24100 [Rhodobacteraceae bacterium]|nr:hypothetical protein [Paracoccaceae bacterium]MBR9822503.1 hypothetical protein [Paracoccaceae bacterium]
MSKVTVRFFHVGKAGKNVPDLEKALWAAHALSDKASGRERVVEGHVLRLERLADYGEYTAGEIVRKQTGDIPPEANSEGLARLSVSEGGGLGHCIAFRYHRRLAIIAIQFDTRAVSINRLMLYLKEIDTSQVYNVRAMIRRDSWEKYNKGKPTKLSFTIAQPTNLAAVEGEVGSVIASTKRLAEIAEAPRIHIEVSMGRGKGSLRKGVVDDVLKFFTTGVGKTEEVKQLQVNSSTDDGTEMIDFLTELLKDTDHLELPDGDPEGHYKVRLAWLKEAFDKHYDQIELMHGAASDGIS